MFAADNKFKADPGTGNLWVHPSYLDSAGVSYIDDRGTAIPYTFVAALIHEFGHALAGKKDNVSSTDYQGENVAFVNKIWRQLGIAPAISYTATAESRDQKMGYAYTNFSPIDAAFNVDDYYKELDAGLRGDWGSLALGDSKDLLIGGSRKNTLESGAGNDFLFGGGNDDLLKGGEGIDTAVYLGKQSD